MKAGSMEALIGANNNVKMINTPMRVYKEAKLKGDTAAMERAMGYVQDFEEKAKDYGSKAIEETAKEIKEERKEQELKRKAATEKCREEAKEYREKLQEKADGAAGNKADGVEISEAGKTALDTVKIGNSSIKVLEGTDVKLYSSEGKPVSTEDTSASVDAKIE